MNKSIIALSVLVFSGLASANTITFMGQVTDQTCVINVEGEASPTITLATIATSALLPANSVAGLKVFNINISGCSAPRFGVSLLPTATNLDGGNLKNIAKSGASTNIALQLLDGADPIDLTKGNYTVLKNQSSDSVVNENIPFGVQYISVLGAATPGVVQGAIEYTISY